MIFKISLLIITIFSTLSQSAEIKGTVRKVLGEVSAKLENELQWKVINIGDEFGENTKLRTGKGAEIEIIFENENVVTIKEESVVFLSELKFEPSTQSSFYLIKLISGRIRAIIKKFRRLDSKFDITTPTAVAGVRGTDFVVINNIKESKILCFDGKVEVRNPKNVGQPVILSAYQMSSVSENLAPSKPVEIPDTFLSEWGVTKSQPDVQEKPLEVMPTPVTKKPEVVETVPTVEKPKEKIPALSPTPSPVLETPAVEKPVTTEEKPAPPVEEKPTAPVEEKPTPPVEEKPVPKEKPEFKFKMNGNVGPINIDAQNWVQIILMPDIGYGKFGMGLYIPIYFDPNKPFFNTKKKEKLCKYWYNKDEWDFASPRDFVHDLLLKILYLRYGQKGEPVLFVKIGSINDFILGHGFILNNYSNMLEFPKVRRIGLQFDLDFNHFGFESMIADIYKAEMFGGRIFVRPLISMKQLPLISKLEFGTTFIEDINPTGNKKDPIVASWGADAGLPVAKSSIFSMLLYTDFSKMMVRDSTIATNKWTYHKGFGYVAGTKGNLSFFLYRAEYRFLKKGYQPEYFDLFYDVNKFAKYTALKYNIETDNPDISGFLAEIGVTFSKFGHFKINFWENLGKQNHDNRLHSELAVKKGIIPKIYGVASYDRYNVVGKYIVSPFIDDRTVLTFDGVYALDSKSELAFMYRKTFKYDENRELKEQVSFSIETRIGF